MVSAAAAALLPSAEEHPAILLIDAKESTGTRHNCDSHSNYASLPSSVSGFDEDSTNKRCDRVMNTTWVLILAFAPDQSRSYNEPSLTELASS